MNNYHDLDEKIAVLALWYVVNTSLSAFYKLISHFGDARTALTDGDEWRTLGVHQAHIARHQDMSDVMAFVARVWHEWQVGQYGVLFVSDDDYPDMLREIYDPPPVLFWRGNVARLSQPQIAMVGSRKPTEYAKKTTFDLAQYLSYEGFVITSGLAGGVDRCAHLGALSQPHKGQTVGVMGTGVDVCYPKNHNALYAQILADGGCLMSELLPATPAVKHNFPRRNRLIAGLSLATVVTEASLQSGTLITARLTAEQGKQVFVVPSNIDNPNAEGSHHLIREGATLIYHPSQILEDLQTMTQGMSQGLPATFSAGKTLFSPIDNSRSPPSDAVSIPVHLQEIYQALGEQAVDLDTLVMATKSETAILLASLLELEMLGVIQTIGGRYAKL